MRVAVSLSCVMGEQKHTVSGGGGVPGRSRRRAARSSRACAAGWGPSSAASEFARPPPLVGVRAAGRPRLEATAARSGGQRAVLPGTGGVCSGLLRPAGPGRASPGRLSGSRAGRGGEARLAAAAGRRPPGLLVKTYQQRRLGDVQSTHRDTRRNGRERERGRGGGIDLSSRL